MADEGIRDDKDDVEGHVRTISAGGPLRPRPKTTSRATSRSRRSATLAMTVRV
jgi:hypothetical protein